MSALKSLFAQTMLWKFRQLKLIITLIFFSFYIVSANVYGVSASGISWGGNSYGQTNMPAGLTNIHAIAAGATHSLACLSDGRVIGWGNNSSGQLDIPPSATNVVDVAAGYAHSVALRADGTVVAWGANYSYQTNVPYGLSGVIKIVCGDNFTLALLNNGRVIGWGGSGGATPPSYLTDGSLYVIAIGAGPNYGMAVDVYGRVYVWGTTDYRISRIPSFLTNMQTRSVAVAGGVAHCLALLDTGVVVGWGDNYYGQTNWVSGAVAIAAGGSTSMAIMSDGTVRIWGDNTHNQRNPPFTLTNVVRIAVGAEHCIAAYYEPVKIVAHPQSQSVIQGGSVTFVVSAMGSQPITYQWRHQGTNIPNATNYFLQLSNIQSNRAGNYVVVVSNMLGALTSDSATLTVYVPPTIVTQPQSQSVPLGSYVQLSVVAQGTTPFFYQWQKNGTNIPGATSTPYTILNAQASDSGNYTVIVSNIAGVVTSAVAVLTVNLPPTITAHPKSQTVLVGSSVTFTVVASGATSYQWRKSGVNIPGATNSYYTINSARLEDAGSYSVAVSNAGGTVFSQSATLTVLPALEGGMVIIWGQTSNLWNGYEYVDVTPPAGLSNITAIAAGGYHGLALTRSGSIIGWGDNRYGQAGTTVSSIKAISAGLNHSLALLSNGTVVAWGRNDYGQTNLPSGLTNIIAISAGWNHNLALRADGTIICWGNNNYGQATPLPGLSNVIAISAGADHSLALRLDGTVVAWGKNDDGQARVPSGLTNVVAVSAGGAHSIALLKNGTVICWGRNTYGQSTPPVGLSNVMAISAGENHSVAILSNNTVVCWGANNYGQLETPQGLMGVSSISAGSTRTMALVLKPLWLELSRRQDQPSKLQLTVRNFDGSNIEPDRMQRLELYAITNSNLSRSEWIKLPISPLYSQGKILYSIDLATNTIQLFRITELP